MVQTSTRRYFMEFVNTCQSLKLGTYNKSRSIRARSFCDVVIK